MDSEVKIKQPGAAWRRESQDAERREVRATAELPRPLVRAEGNRIGGGVLGRGDYGRDHNRTA